jgi:hypothetical protein
MSIVTEKTALIEEDILFGRTSVNAWTDPHSGISWSAIIAGALTAIAISIIVIALGSGIGMSVISPYSYSPPSATTMTVIGALWLVFAQAIGFATGGYVTARLRRSPTPIHSGEVKFRDGASGLIVWAVGVVLTLLVVAAAVSRVDSKTDGSANNTTALVAATGSELKPLDYFSDALLRPGRQAVAGAAAPVASANGSVPGTSNDTGDQRSQINRILLTALGPAGISADDRAYLAQIVSAQTGLGQEDAQHRVDEVVSHVRADAMQAAESARKAAAYLSFWTFMSLLFGAVCATLGGILGGDLRDESSIGYPAGERTDQAGIQNLRG